MLKQPPKTITITIQNEDRLKAERYTNSYNCLVATALKRMGYKEVQSNVRAHYIDGFKYWSDQTYCAALCAIPSDSIDVGPYYRPGIVGKQITLTLEP